MTDKYIYNIILYKPVLKLKSSYNNLSFTFLQIALSKPGLNWLISRSTKTLSKTGFRVNKSRSFASIKIDLDSFKNQF